MVKRRPPGLEELGARILPSATPLPSLAPAAGVPSTAALAGNRQTLGGHGWGQYSVTPTIDLGVRYDLQGTAHLDGMGKVAVAGNLQGVGFVQQGQASGELTFTNSRGSVTLALHGPVQPGFSPLPQAFTYDVVSGTGAYEHLSGHGALHLALQALPTGAFPHPRGAFAFSLTPSEGVHPPPAVTGVEGVVLVGPTAPVARPGVGDVRPLPGTVITVRPVGGGAEIARVRADARGRFVLALPPGRYEIVPLPPTPGQALPRGTPQTVVVQAGALTSVVVHYDSGIR
jgi:hypothetical protein